MSVKIILFTLLMMVAGLGCQFDGASNAAGLKGNVDAGGSANFDGGSDENGSPLRPAAQPIELELTVAGTGTYPALDLECVRNSPVGAFEGTISGDGNIDENGAYLGTLAMASAAFQTPAGCEIPALDVGVVTSARLRALLRASTMNCDGYCTARARSAAMAECGAEADAVACRSAAEAEYQASCTVACNRVDHVIVAETELAADVAASLLLSQSSGQIDGAITAGLSFDHIENGSGQPVAENP